MATLDILPGGVTVVVAVTLLSLVYLVIYRLFLHPLANVPGPKLAAITTAHEFYYDCIKGGGGQHAFKMQEMHRVYGSCVRINPGEVHIDGRVDPSFWDVLYSNTNKLSKDSWYYSGFGNGLSMLATTSSDLHRARRSAVSNYFGSGHVRRYEGMALDQISKLMDRLKRCSENGEVIDLANAYRCLTMDVVTSFAVPEPRKMLDLADFGRGFNALMRNFSRLITLQRHLKVVIPLLESIPEWLMIRMDTTGSTLQLVEFRKSFQTEAKKTVDRKGQPPSGHAPSVLDTIYGAPELATQDKFVGRIVEEAMNIVGAGTETTAATLTLLTYYVLAFPAILDKLMAELSAAAKGSQIDVLDYHTLEKVPYLQSCINEALRISNPVTGRLPRFNPHMTTSFTDPTGKKSYTFPPGTIMSMSMPDLHFNESIYPEPYAFKPERWTEATPEHKALMQRYFVPFGKGSRACLGMEMAKMELVLTAGNIFHRFGRSMRLHETTERDVGWAYDFFAPYIPADSKGLRVVIS